MSAGQHPSGITNSIAHGIFDVAAVIAAGGNFNTGVVNTAAAGDTTGYAAGGAPSFPLNLPAGALMTGLSITQEILLVQAAGGGCDFRAGPVATGFTTAGVLLGSDIQTLLAGGSADLWSAFVPGSFPGTTQWQPRVPVLGPVTLSSSTQPITGGRIHIWISYFLARV